VNAEYGDPSGQFLLGCGLLSESVWKVRAFITRTSAYPFKESDVHWLGSTSAERLADQTYQLFPVKEAPDKIQLAGTFGRGFYRIVRGEVVAVEPTPCPLQRCELGAWRNRRRGSLISWSRRRSGPRGPGPAPVQTLGKSTRLVCRRAEDDPLSHLKPKLRTQNNRSARHGRRLPLFARQPLALDRIQRRPDLRQQLLLSIRLRNEAA
jgi:hypothetical protein